MQQRRQLKNPATTAYRLSHSRQARRNTKRGKENRKGRDSVGHKISMESKRRRKRSGFSKDSLGCSYCLLGGITEKYISFFLISFLGHLFFFLHSLRSIFLRRSRGWFVEIIAVVTHSRVTWQCLHRFKRSKASASPHKGIPGTIIVATDSNSIITKSSAHHNLRRPRFDTF